MEYEEEFLYVLFLMKHFFLDATEAECKALVQRCEQVLEGAGDARLDVCTAFLQDDGTAFHDALCAMLKQDEERGRELLAAGGLPAEVAATEAHFNVEGLALLRLAEMKGFATEREYLTVPSLARTQASFAFQPEAWKEG